MSFITENRVQIDAQRAQKLERLAISQGTTPEALIARALDLLFLMEPAAADLAPELTADWQLLQRLDAEAATTSSDRPGLPGIGTPSGLDLTRGNVTHAVPVPPGSLRRLGEER